MPWTEYIRFLSIYKIAAIDKPGVACSSLLWLLVAKSMLTPSKVSLPAAHATTKVFFFVFSPERNTEEGETSWTVNSCFAAVTIRNRAACYTVAELCIESRHERNQLA